MEFDLKTSEDLVKAALSGESLEQALILLNRQCKILKSKVDGGPVLVVSQEAYEIANSLQQWARQLALCAAERGEDKWEEIAWQLRASPILTMHSHRRHRVGPAMIDWADCNQRLGNTAKADMLYEAVIKDFKGLLERVPVPGTETFTALESLRKALQHHSHTDQDALRKVKERLSEWAELEKPG